MFGEYKVNTVNVSYIRDKKWHEKRADKKEFYRKDKIG